jgi:hypothetical protein
MVSMIDNNVASPIETTLQLRDAIKPLAPKGAENNSLLRYFKLYALK